MSRKAVASGKSRTNRQRAYWRSRRIRVNGRLVAPLPESYHGKRSTYNYYGCHCDLCNKANTKRQRTERVPEPSTPEPKFVRTELPAAEPVQRRQPAKRKPARQQSPEPEVPNLGVEIPEVTREVRAEIATMEQLRDVLAAYHTPQWTVAMPSQPGWEKRSARGCLIIVDPDGVVVFIGTADQSNAAPESLRERSAPKSTRRGGCGTTLPTSYAEVIDRLRELGCEVDTSSARHVSVTLPNGERRTLPKTTSDWRAVKNTVAQFRADGLDLRRK